MFVFDFRDDGDQKLQDYVKFLSSLLTSSAPDLVLLSPRYTAFILYMTMEYRDLGVVARLTILR